MSKSKKGIMLSEHKTLILIKTNNKSICQKIWSAKDVFPLLGSENIRN